MKKFQLDFINKNSTRRLIYKKIYKNDLGHLVIEHVQRLLCLTFNLNSYSINTVTRLKYNHRV